MKRRTERWICLVFALFILCAQFVVVYADPEVTSPEPEPIEEEYTGVDYIGAGLTFTNNNKAKCEGDIQLDSGYYAQLTVKLKKNGIVIVTWSRYVMVSNIQAGISEEYPAVTGSSYEVVAEATIYDYNDHYICTATDSTGASICP